jgi:TRAP-type C4-dicarboxylate transport system permease large subunit
VPRRDDDDARSDIDALFADGDDDGLYQPSRSIAVLEQQLEAERDARREERFVFIILCVILLNVVLFSVLDGLGGPLALLVLELIILVPLARRMGIDEIHQILSNVLDRMAGKARNGA